MSDIILPRQGVKAYFVGDGCCFGFTLIANRHRFATVTTIAICLEEHDNICTSVSVMVVLLDYSHLNV